MLLKTTIEIADLPIKNVIFHGYVELPEGTQLGKLRACSFERGDSTDVNIDLTMFDHNSEIQLVKRLWFCGWLFSGRTCNYGSMTYIVA